MTRARIALAAAATAAYLLAAGGPARAYVRNRTGAGQPIAWSKTCLGIIVYPAAIADMLPPDQVLAAAAAAAGAWSAGQISGTALDIQVAPDDAAPPAVGYDGQSSLIFQRDKWCSSSDPPGSCSYDPSALALTTVVARVSTGEILDADIEINATVFLWSDLDLGTQASANVDDLQNALTHEVGHFIGLDHPCVAAQASSEAHPLDNLGNPAPDCNAAPEAVMESTMFPSAVPGDLSKRTLAPDDELAAREIYPASGGAPAVCAPPQPKRLDSSEGCAVGGAAAPASGPLPWLAAAVALGAARRRSRRRN